MGRGAALALGMFCAALPAAAGADVSAAVMADRLTHTPYPNRAVPAGYDMPISSEPAGTDPREVVFAFTRSADHALTQLRFDLYDDDASLKKKYPAAWSKSGFDVELNPVVYRFGSYHATCSAHYGKWKGQVADVCSMVLATTVLNVETVFAVPPGTTVDSGAATNAFLDSIRKTTTAFVTNGAAYYLGVSGLPP